MHERGESSEIKKICRRRFSSPAGRRPRPFLVPTIYLKLNALSPSPCEITVTCSFRPQLLSPTRLTPPPRTWCWPSSPHSGELCRHPSVRIPSPRPFLLNDESTLCLVPRHVPSHHLICHRLTYLVFLTTFYPFRSDQYRFHFSFKTTVLF